MRLKSPGTECFRQLSGRRELQRFLARSASLSQAVNQAARKAVAAADAIHDVRDVVVAADQEILSDRSSTPTIRCATRSSIRAA